ncbi:MAG: hypothetical protein IKD45_03720 [Clostridia bacterium]|nr:hypothetical protein [Clostridia bacterium]
MNIMNKLLVKLLSRYYLIVALGCEFLSPEARHGAFSVLKKIYRCEGGEELDKYERLSECEPYARMMTLADYDRERRIAEYSALLGNDLCMSEEDKIILAAKGEALRYKQNIVVNGTNFTPDTLAEQLLDAASKGNIHAISALALMEHYGIGIGENRARAKRNVDKAVKWNDLDAMLLGMEIYPECREYYMKKLNTLFSADSDSELLAAVSAGRFETAPEETDNNTALMEKAFLTGVVERERYEVKFADYIYTDVLRGEDKSKIIANYKKETASIYDDIPTHIDMSDSISTDYSAFSDLKLVREGEIRKIKRNLVSAHTRRHKYYRPMLIECQDTYVLSMYKKAIMAALSGAAMVKLDASLLTNADLSESKDNIFLRSASDSGRMATVFLIENCHALGEAGAKELSKYIRGDMRAAFRLNYPQVRIDLSPCLFVFFAEGACGEAMEELCDVVRASPVMPEEKEAAIENILDYKRICYGLDALTLDSEVMEALKSKNTERISELCEEFAKYAACEPDITEINKDILDTVLRDLRVGTVKFGF